MSRQAYGFDASPLEHAFAQPSNERTRPGREVGITRERRPLGPNEPHDTCEKGERLE
jgi:hypothetical protein